MTTRTTTAPRKTTPKTPAGKKTTARKAAAPKAAPKKTQPAAATSESTGDGAPVAHTVGRLEYKDPCTLVVDPFNHRKKRQGAADSTEPDPDLIASVEAFGVQIPVLVRPQADGTTYGVIWGQRRRRAAELAAEKAKAAGEPYRLIPCLVRDDLAGADDQAVFLSMVENKQRAQGTDRDDLDALEQLALMDISDTRRGNYARALGYKPAEVKAANRAARLSDAELRRAIEEFDLIEAADYAEVADVPEALRILQAAKEDDAAVELDGRGAWAHAMAELKQMQADRAREKEVTNELLAAGVRIVHFSHRWDYTSSRPLEELRTAAGAEISVNRHKATCPGHAAAIDPDTITPVMLCTQWAHYGHVLPGEQEDKDAIAEQRQAQRAERKRVITGNKKWRAARTVRQDFIKDLCARKEISDRLRVFVLSMITGTSYDYSRFVGGHRTGLMAQFLGVPDPNANRSQYSRVSDPFGKVIHRAGKAKWWRPLLAQVAACVETERLHDGAWRHPDIHVREWLRLLEAEGYRLSEIETEISADTKDADDGGQDQNDAPDLQQPGTGTPVSQADTTGKPGTDTKPGAAPSGDTGTEPAPQE